MDIRARSIVAQQVIENVQLREEEEKVKTKYPGTPAILVVVVMCSFIANTHGAHTHAQASSL